MEPVTAPQLTAPVGIPRLRHRWLGYLPLLVGPALFWLVGFSGLVPLEPPVARVLGVTAWMMLWWVTEIVPMPVTAFLPLVLFPTLGLLDLNATAAHYFGPTVFLFFSGFVFALALERHGLHARIALHIVRLVGTRSQNLVGGFAAATAFLSLWVNNTAAALLVLPIATSVLRLLEDEFREGNLTAEFRKLAASLLLGLAYGASIGGIATPIGTPTNAVLVGFLRSRYGIDVPFAGWFAVGLPLAVLMLGAAYLILTKVVFRTRTAVLPNASDVVATKLRELGPVTFPEGAVAVVFALTALGWVLRVPLSAAFGLDFLNDTTIGITGALLLFLTPDFSGKSRYVFDWKGMEGLPWGILFLIGGGLALAKTLENAGVVRLIGEAIARGGFTSYLPLLAALAGVVLLLKLLIANTALATISLPMVFGIAEAAGIEPILLAAPVTFAASFAFVLPMSTPPNAIVLTTGHVRVPDMVRAGALLTAVGFGLLLLFSKLYPWMIW